MGDVTQMLLAVEAGDACAADQILPLVYDELRQLAARKMAHESPGQTLDATSLVHEAFVRLVDTKKVQSWNSRGHFFCAAAEAMRRILIERARHKHTVKAGGEHLRLDLSDVAPAAVDPDLELLTLNEVLEKLERQDKRKADVVKLRFFAGLTIEETADALGIAKSTANDDWAFARCWLRLEMDSGK